MINSNYINNNFVIQQFRTSNYRYEHGKRTYPETTFRYDGKHSIYTAKNGVGKSVTVKLLYSCLNAKRLSDTKVDLKTLYETSDFFNNAMVFSYLGELYLLDVINYKSSKMQDLKDEDESNRVIKYLMCKIPKKSWETFDLDNIAFSVKEKQDNGYKINSVNDFTSRLTSYLESTIKAENIGDSSKINFLKYNVSEIDRKFASLGINLPMMRKFYEDASFSEGSLTEYFKVYNTEKKFLQEVLNPVLVQSYNHKKDTEIIQSSSVHKIYSIDNDLSNKFEESVKFYSENRKNIENKDKLVALKDIIEKISKFVAEADMLSHDIKANTETLESAYTWAIQNKNKSISENVELEKKLASAEEIRDYAEYVIMSNDYKEKLAVQQKFESEVEALEAEDNELKIEIEQLRREKRFKDAQTAWKQHKELSSMLLDYQKTLDEIISDSNTENIDAIRYSLKLHFKKLLVELEGRLETAENTIEDLRNDKISIDLNKNSLQHKEDSLNAQIKNLQKKVNEDNTAIQKFLGKINLEQDKCLKYDEYDNELYDYNVVTKHIIDNQVNKKAEIKELNSHKNDLEFDLNNVYLPKINKAEKQKKENILTLEKLGRQIEVHKQIENLCREKHFISDNYPEHKTASIKNKIQEKIASLQIKKTKLLENKENIHNKELISYPVDFLEAMDNEGIYYELGKKYIQDNNINISDEASLIYYSIITNNETDKNKILELAKGYHFSFILPVILSDEIITYSNIISGIDKRLLEESYCSVKISEINSKIDIIDKDILNYQNEFDFISILQSLRKSIDYTEISAENIEKQIAKLTKENNELDNALASYLNEKENIQKDISSVDYNIKSATVELEEIERQLEYSKSDFISLIQRFTNNSKNISKYEEEVEEIADSIDNISDEKIQINNELNKQENRKRDLERQIENITNSSKVFEDAVVVSADQILNGIVAQEKWDNLKKSKQEQIEQYEFKISDCSQKMDILEKSFYGFTEHELDNNEARDLDIVEAEIESTISEEQAISQKIRNIQNTTLLEAKTATIKIEQKIRDTFDKVPFVNEIDVSALMKTKTEAEEVIFNIKENIENNNDAIVVMEDYVKLIPMKYKVFTNTPREVKKDAIIPIAEQAEQHDKQYKQCENAYRDMKKQATSYKEVDLYEHFSIACPDNLLSSDLEQRLDDFERCQNDIKILLQIIDDNTQEIELVNNQYENLYIYPIVDLVKDYIIFTDKKIKGLNNYGFKGDCKHTVFQIVGWHETTAEELPILERRISNFTKSFIEKLSEYEDFNDRKALVNKISSGWKNIITKIQNVVLEDDALSSVAMYIYIKKANGNYEKCRWTKVPSLASGAMCFAAGLTVQLEISKLLSPDEKGISNMSMPIFLDNPGATVSSEEYLKEIFNCLDQHHVQLLAVAPPENEKLYSRFPRYYALTLEENKNQSKQNIAVEDKSNYSEPVQEVTTQTFNILDVAN